MSQQLKPSVSDIKAEIAKLGIGEFKDGSSKRRGWTYHKIPFKEFDDIPVHKRINESELNMILNDMDFTDKKILEIGCANGLYSFSISKLCKSIDAYERDDQVFKINQMIQLWKSPEFDNINFINKGADESILKNKKYNVCIMLNVHMWIEKQIGRRKTIQFMRTLSTVVDSIYFQTAHASSSGMSKVKHLKDENDIINYLKRCGFSDIEIMDKPEKHTDKSRVFIKAKTGNVLANKRKVFIMKNENGDVVKEYKMRLKLGVRDNEIKWLTHLSDWDRTPNLIDYKRKSIIMNFCGTPLSKDNIPDDFVEQLNNIIKGLKERGCCHNDIKMTDILVQDGKLKVIDFEWATKPGERLPENWPPWLSVNLKGNDNFNDEEAAKKIINFCTEQGWLNT